MHPLALIVGPGPMGVLWATRLQRAQYPVAIFWHRGGHAPSHVQVQWQGTIHDHLSIPVLNALSPDAGYEIFLCTKAQHSLAALQPFAAYPSAVRSITCIQNGMGQHDAIAAGFSCPIAGCYTTDAAHVTSDGHYRLVHEGTVELGLFPEGVLVDDDFPALQALAKQNPHIRFTARVREKLLHKLAINCLINPLTVLYDCCNGELPGNAEALQRMRNLADELQPLLTRHGCIVDALGEALRVCEQTAGNVSSMLQDVRAARTTEIDFLNGWVVSEAEKWGLACDAHRVVINDLRARLQQS